MSGLLWEMQAAAGPARVWLPNGSFTLLVRVRMFNDGIPDAFCDLHPEQARELALALIVCAAHAERPRAPHHNHQHP
jgi:hypothetical protein